MAPMAQYRAPVRFAVGARREISRCPMACKSLAMPLSGRPDSLHLPSLPRLTAATILPEVPSPEVGPDMGFCTGFASKYSTGKHLGQGSFGCVFHGTHKDTGREVAVKMMSKVRGKMTKQRTLEKIQQEVSALQRMQGCRGVVDVLDTFETLTDVIIVTELCGGGDLQKLSDAFPVINERCLAFMAWEVLKVVSACSARGIVHGDIKPANFVLKHPRHNPLFSTDPMYASPPWLKVVDFGCSQNLPGKGNTLSKRAGTPVFMAPEIFQRSYGTQADVWSVGIMLYQVYCKRFPFWETYEIARNLALEDISDAVMMSEPRFNFGQFLSMSPQGVDFLKSLLIKSPKQRPTAEQALGHPWLATQMGQVAAEPKYSRSLSHAGRMSNNIVRAPTIRNPVAQSSAHSGARSDAHSVVQPVEQSVA